MTLSPTRLDVDGGRVMLRMGDQAVPAGERPAARLRLPLMGGVRPEAIALVADAADVLRATVAHVELLGHETLVYADVGDVRLVVRTPGMAELAPGAHVALRVDPARVHLFESGSGARLVG